MKQLSISMIVLTVCLFALAVNAQAAQLFFDDFDSGASSAWDNPAGYGDWYAHDGVYDAESPDNDPTTYSSVTTLPSLTDFVLDLNINDVYDGGVWLRSPSTARGVLLVTHGRSNSFYWHIVDGTNNWTSYDPQGYSGLNGNDIMLKIKVIGDTYEAYINGASTPLTTLSTSAFSSGKVGLYDFSGQTFDNVRISDFSSNPVPEPTTMALFGFGSIAAAFLRRKRRAC